MGLFDSLFSSKKTSKQTVEQEQQTVGTRGLLSEETQLEDSTRTAATTAEEVSVQDQTVTSLDEQTQGIFRDLIASLSGQLEAGGGSILSSGVLQAVPDSLDFAKFLGERAGQTEGILNEQTDAIVAEARRIGGNELEIAGANLTRGAGSNLNSIVQAGKAQGSADLESSLAALRGTLGISAREAGSADLATAFGAITESGRAGADIQIAGQVAGTEQIAQLADVLTGATTKTVGKTTITGRTTEEEQITRLLEALRDATEVTTQDVSLTGTTTVKETGQDSLFSNLLSIASLAAPK